jgi:hypothetical protein
LDYDASTLKLGELLELLFVELDPLQKGFAEVLVEVSCAAETGMLC